MTLSKGYPPSLGLQRLPDFAWLRPTGGLADSCLDEWLACTSRDGIEHVYHKFLHGFVPGLEPAANRTFRGSFRLNLADLGSPGAGWVLGSDFPLDDDSPAAKFVVCTQARAASTKVASVHARFNFNAYGILTVTPATRAGFAVVTSEGEKRIQGMPYAIVEQSALFKFGECSYVFSYTPQVRSPFYLSALCRHMRFTLGAFELPAPVSTLAMPSNISLHGYVLDRGVLGPASGVSQAALAKATGTPVDVMRLSRSGSNRREFATIKTLKHIKRISANPPSIVRLCEIVDEHSPVEVMAIFEPQLTTTLDDAIDRESLSEQQSLVVLQQCLEGVAWLHNNGLMHRNLSPATIALKSIHPAVAYIYDFGYTRVATMCRTNDVPPTCYLAPEMLHLNLNPRGRPYDCNIDLWAMGMTALSLLNQRLWPDCDLERHQRTFYPDMNMMLRRLADMSSDVADTIHFMLRPEPHDRFPAWLAADSIRNHVAQFTTPVNDLVTKTQGLAIGSVAGAAEAAEAARQAFAGLSGGHLAFDTANRAALDAADDEAWVADDEWAHCDEPTPSLAT